MKMFSGSGRCLVCLIFNNPASERFFDLRVIVCSKTDRYALSIRRKVERWVYAFATYWYSS